jgi:hypothetical protein
MDHFEGLRQLWKGPKMDIKQEGKEAIEKADAKLTSLAEIVTRKGATKWVVLAVIVLVGIVLVMLLWPGKARATESPDHYGVRSPSAVSGAVSNSKAIAGATAGAVEGTASGGSASISEGDSKAYALGLSLTTSQGDCPVLGSFNVAFVGATYLVKLCHAMQAARLMQAVGMSRESIVNVVCSVPEIAENASECRR